MDCDLEISIAPVIGELREDPVCDPRGPHACNFVSIFLTKFAFVESFTCQFVRTLFFVKAKNYFVVA